MNHKTFKLLHLLFLFSTLTACADNHILKGHWEGEAISGSKRLEVSIDVSESSATYDVPAMGIYVSPFSEATVNRNLVTFEIEGKEPIILDGVIKGNQITGKINGEVPFSIEKVSTKPFTYIEEEVSYKSGDVTLSGTFIHPNAPNPYPAIAFVHGSGKMTRETMRNRAYLFVKNGIAALIYDRRGRGKSKGNSEDILPIQTLASDAVAGVDYLKSRADVKQIGIYGLSQGGWVAPLAVTISPDISFLITISAPSITPNEQNDYVMANISGKYIRSALVKSKVPSEIIDDIVNTHIENYEATRMELKKKNNNEEEVPGFSSFDPINTWQKIKIPVLAVWGSDDRLIPALKSKELIEEALKTAENKDYNLKIFPGANHSIRLSSDKEKFNGRWQLMVPGSQKFIVGWTKEHVK